MRFIIAGFGSLFVVVSLALQSHSNSGVEQESAIRPCTSWTGPESAVSEQKFVRIGDESQWESVWLEHLGKDRDQAFNDSDMQVHVDFDRFEVIALFRGAGWNSRGIRFEEFNETADMLTVRYDSISYQTSGIGGGGGRVRVSPFAFVVFPRSDKTIRLEENIQGLKAGLPKWRERAVLGAE